MTWHRILWIDSEQSSCRLLDRNVYVWVSSLFELVCQIQSRLSQESSQESLLTSLQCSKNVVLQSLHNRNLTRMKVNQALCIRIPWLSIWISTPQLTILWYSMLAIIHIKLKPPQTLIKINNSSPQFHSYTLYLDYMLWNVQGWEFSSQ